MSDAKTTATEKAMFAAGCFWGTEAAFRQVPGVLDVTVGYSGGTVVDPTYPEVKTGKTGHAEVALVEFDPAKTSYDALLEAFWKMHDPTTLNRQGVDVGTQYRSGIYFFTAEQRTAAETSKAKWQSSGKFGDPIVTEILPAQPFYRAEEYHQRYFEKTGEANCHLPGK